MWSDKSLIDNSGKVPWSNLIIKYLDFGLIKAWLLKDLKTDKGSDKNFSWSDMKKGWALDPNAHKWLHRG